MQNHKCKFGDFDKTNGAFKIKTPELPKPWCNYLTNGNFFSMISHIGTGFSFLKEYRLNSLIRRDSEPLYPEHPGRAIYIKESGDKFWMPNLVLSKDDVDEYQCVHQQGKTEITTSKNELQFTSSYFVPQTFDTEVCRMQITNNSTKEKTFELYSVADICMGMNCIDSEDMLFDDLFRQEQEINGALVSKKRFNRPAGSEVVEEWGYNGYMVSTVKPNQFETRRDKFLGAHGSFLRPKAVETSSLSNQDTIGAGIVKCMQWQITLAPNQSINIDLSIGLCKEADLDNTIKSLSNSNNIDLYESQSEEFWQNFQKQGHKLRSQDYKLDAVVNYWTPYQAYITSHLGRHPSFYSGGSWTCGIRDQAQDAFGILPFLPEYVGEEVLRLCKNIWSDGRFPHLVSRIAMPPEESSKCDSGLWLIFIVDEYIKETGDVDVLNKEVGYLDGDLKESVFKHLQKLIDLSLTKMGAHGLPLFRKGDWNDALDGVGKNGKGESVWMGQFLVWLLRKMQNMSALVKDNASQEKYKNNADKLSDLINDIAWNGQWYIRGFDDNGKAFGTPDCQEGKIFLNAQTWAVLSGVATGNRAKTCLESALKMLMTPWGPKTLTPAFSTTKDEIGIISAFTPGSKENGGVFLHAAAFFTAALAKVGKKDEAFEVLNKFLPANQQTEVFELEPYTFCNFIFSTDSQIAGRGYYHWLTGTGAWMNRIIIDYIFGVQADYQDLIIDSKIPEELANSTVVRNYRGKEYTISYAGANQAPVVKTVEIEV